MERRAIGMEVCWGLGRESEGSEVRFVFEYREREIVDGDGRVRSGAFDAERGVAATWR